MVCLQKERGLETKSCARGDLTKLEDISKIPLLGSESSAAHVMYRGSFRGTCDVPRKTPVGREYGFCNSPAIKARVLTNRVTQAGSQWIVAQGPLSHLQFLGATKSSAKDLPLPGLEIARDSSSL